MCPVPVKDEDLYQAGFACCPFSQQNAARFSKDVIAEKHPVHDVSYQAVKGHMSARMPKYSIIENSSGMFMARGGGVASRASDHVIAEFNEIPGQTAAHSSGNAHPLPTARPRFLAYTSRDEHNPASLLAKEHAELQKIVESNMPQHELAGSVSSDRHGPTSLSPDRQVSGQKESHDAAAYHKHLATALDAAIAKGRLPKDVKLPPLAQRPSLCHAALKEKAAWWRAQADIYYMIAKHQNEQKDLHVKLWGLQGAPR
jgi:hypothetical protein